jgi:hypothetical protein
VWLKRLKIAIATEDIELLGELLEETTEIKTPEDAQSAVILLAQAKELLEAKKSEAQSAMQQIKKNINFLKSGVADTPAKFDITS